MKKLADGYINKIDQLFAKHNVLQYDKLVKKIKLLLKIKKALGHKLDANKNGRYWFKLGLLADNGSINQIGIREDGSVYKKIGNKVIKLEIDKAIKEVDMMLKNNTETLRGQIRNNILENMVNEKMAQFGFIEE